MVLGIKSLGTKSWLGLFSFRAAMGYHSNKVEMAAYH
jgi:hypothetical protein